MHYIMKITIVMSKQQHMRKTKVYIEILGPCMVGLTAPVVYAWLGRCRPATAPSSKRPTRCAGATAAPSFSSSSTASMQRAGVSYSVDSWPGQATQTHRYVSSLFLSRPLFLTATLILVQGHPQQILDKHFSVPLTHYYITIITIW